MQDRCARTLHSLTPHFLLFTSFPLYFPSRIFFRVFKRSPPCYLLQFEDLLRRLLQEFFFYFLLLVHEFSFVHRRRPKHPRAIFHPSSLSQAACRPRRDVSSQIMYFLSSFPVSCVWIGAAGSLLYLLSLSPSSADWQTFCVTVAAHFPILCNSILW